MALADKSWLESTVAHILLKCPTKSLMRFKCVSKSWSTLIQYPNSISKTILFNANNKNIYSTTSQLLISRINKSPNPNDKEPVVFSLCPYHNLREMSTTEYLPFVHSPDRGSTRVNLVGSCNGIVCLHDHYGDNFILWNPATSELKILPPPRFQYFNSKGIKTSADVILSGFEYLQERKNYKVIKLMKISEFIMATSVGDHCIEIYSLEEDSWKRIHVQGMGVVDVFRNSSTVVKGTLSWFTVNHTNDEERIVTFDMGKEVFSKTRLPDNINRFSWFIWFYPLGDCLTVCVSQGDSRRVNNRWWIDVWVLLEIGVEESWSRLYRIDPVPGLYWCWYPLGFWKNGKVFLDNGKGQVVLYDMDTKEITDLRIQGVYRTIQIVTYKESKVRLVKDILD
ncbi:F-box/kelch-repeat protein At3g23880-like [Carica papaya]|uniref:F-box/kelch-repeat protein At3g23880-like n=1 Tax=Carica papaya TaxID=3649 RepID=UPI000B8D11CA|nr:F-box/kelch-repeat protein At3g23880-like [Carica papaya]